MKKSLPWILFLIGIAGCAEISDWIAKKKTPSVSNHPLSKHARAFFWKTFHANQIQAIPQAEKLLMEAYLANTNDPILVSYLAFLHIWKLTERNFRQPNPLIVDEIELAKTYFTKAHELAPNNPIYLGFLGDTYLISGKIFNDERSQIKGYFLLKTAISKWPEFNYFTAGYPMSTLNPSDPHFQEGLVWQSKTLDSCAGKKINRQNPNFAPYMKRETRIGKKRACWNSWAAPHNFEGFFMNMGDMLVKSGDWKTAIIIYRNARLAKTYHHWPYRHMLEHRIAQASQNVKYFNEKQTDPSKKIMFNSGYGCMVCHQNTQKQTWEHYPPIKNG